MRKSLLICMTIFFTVTSFAGNNPRFKNFTSSGDVYGTRVFVENKGQFDSKPSKGEKVLYAFDNGNEKIYFTPSGLIYEHCKTLKISEEEKEEREKEAEGKGQPYPEPDFSFKYVYMNWVGSNIGSSYVLPDEKQSHYFTYGQANLNSNTFKKITYKNIYDKIDIEYVIPEEKKYGIKYSVIVHPGGDISKLKMVYSGDVKKIKLEDGEVIIKSSLDKITEHLPKSFYANGQQVVSAYKLTNNTISFNFPNAYDNTKTLIIDPWLTTITTLSVNNYGYDVDFDFIGNTYVYGGNVAGTARCKVAKYNSLGVLIWTFSGNIITPITWNSGSVWSCNFLVHKSLSKIYVARNQGLPNIVRLDASGNYDNFVSNGLPSIGEVWSMDYICNGDLIVYGGVGTSGEIVNSTTGAIQLVTTFSPGISGCCQDIVAYATDVTGDAFVYFLGHAQLNNQIAKVAQSFTNSVWRAPSGAGGFTYLQNKSLYVGANAGNAVAFNALAVNMNYLYCYDGQLLLAYNKNTGAIISSINTGLGQRVQGGIAVDDCDNVYVGGNGSIKCYNFNGTSFTTLAPITVTTNTQYQYIYDVMLNRITKELYVSGSEFVGTFSAIHSQFCNPVFVPNQCNFGQLLVNAVTASITCATLGNATISTVGGLGPFSYTWIPSGQTGSVGTGLAPGTHTIVVHDAGINMTNTTTIFFTPATPLTGNFSASAQLPCHGVNNATASITNLMGGSGNQSYLWTNGQTTHTTASISGLGIGNYSLLVTDALTGCTINQTFQITQPPPLTLNVVASATSACANTPVNLLGLISGGTQGGYSYSWAAGPPTATYAATQAVGGPHIYTLTGFDVNNCPKSNTILITYTASPVLSVSHVSICPLETATLNVSGAATYTWNNNTTGSTFTDNPLATTSYTVIGTALTSCTSAATASIILKTAPIPILSSNSGICNGQVLNLYSSGGASYAWTGPLVFLSNQQNPIITSASPPNSGVYNVTVTAANSCTAPANISVTIHPTPILSALGGTLCTTHTLNLSATSIPGVTYQWSGQNGFSSNQQNPVYFNPPVSASGNYTVKATSLQGCTNTAIAHVAVTAYANTSITSNAPKCEGDLLTLNASNGLQHNWAGPNGFVSNLANPVITTVSLLANGIYSLQSITGPCVANTTKNIIIYPVPVLTLTYNAPLCENKTLLLSATTTSAVSIYAWSGPNSFTSTLQYPLINNANQTHSGVYNLTVSDVHNCQTSAQLTVGILPNPTLTALSTKVCLNDTAILKASGADSYVWYSATGYVSNAANLIITSASNSNTSVYTVYGTALNSCTAAATASVDTWPLPKPHILVSPKNAMCLNSEVVLHGFGGNSYTWQTPLHLLHGGQTIHFVVNNMGYSGIYTLTASDAMGCLGYATTTLLVNDLPNGSLLGTKMQGCVPFCSDFSFSSSKSATMVAVNWELNAKVIPSKNFSQCFNKPGDYIIKGYLTDTVVGCSNNITYTINAWPLPVADFTWSPTKPVENTDDVLFTNSSKGDKQVQWTWFINPDINTPRKRQGEHMTYFFGESGSYAVALITENVWSCLDTVVKTVIVEQDFNVFVPDAFTPNGDGRNDVFEVKGTGIKFLNLSVFDRWGKLIFDSNELNAAWDGTYKGQECEQGVYNWKINVSALNGKTKVLTGKILIVR